MTSALCSKTIRSYKMSIWMLDLGALTLTPIIIVRSWSQWAWLYLPFDWCLDIGWSVVIDWGAVSNLSLSLWHHLFDPTLKISIRSRVATRNRKFPSCAVCSVQCPMKRRVFIQCPLNTWYIEGTGSSHSRPSSLDAVFDSKIYFTPSHSQWIK